jgi:hypothetical protein
MGLMIISPSYPSPYRHGFFLLLSLDDLNRLVGDGSQELGGEELRDFFPLINKRGRRLAYGTDKTWSLPSESREQIQTQAKRRRVHPALHREGCPLSAISDIEGRYRYRRVRYIKVTFGNEKDVVAWFYGYMKITLDFSRAT